MRDGRRLPTLGRCHCGDTAFEFDVAADTVTSCTCSICSKRGALWVYCRPAQFRLLKAPQHASTYRWAKGFVQLHFCGRCGCTTYNESPTSRAGQADFDSPLIAVNARLLEGFDAARVRIDVVDGNNLW